MTREEATKTLTELCRLPLLLTKKETEAVDMAIEALKEPERKKGEWVIESVHARNISEEGFLCSNCSFGDFGLFRDYKPNYCPNCGAEMEEK